MTNLIMREPAVPVITMMKSFVSNSVETGGMKKPQERQNMTKDFGYYRKVFVELNIFVVLKILNCSPYLPVLVMIISVPSS